MVNTNKYYCKVVTRNFPVNITPIISRYTQITKYLDILQIAMCLKSQATVDIIDGDKAIRLSPDNYMDIIKNIEKARKEKEIKESVAKDEETNKVKSEEVTERTPVQEPLQQDPENPDTFNEDKFYEGIDDTEYVKDIKE